MKSGQSISNPCRSSSTIMTASPMKRNQRRKRTKYQILTKRIANQERDNCRSYKRVTINKTTAVRCHQFKSQNQNKFTQLTITQRKKRHQNVEKNERGDSSKTIVKLTLLNNQ